MGKTNFIVNGRHRGFTLLELIIAVTIFAMILPVVVLMLNSTVTAYSIGREDLYLEQQASILLGMLSDGIRQTSVVMIPNARVTQTNFLALSLCIDNDNDGRRDEDTGFDMTADGRSGLKAYDDNGNGGVDEADNDDDDEDGVKNEDPWNGEDDDNDGMIDEDVHENMTGDGAPGWKGFDDDGDLAIDEGDQKDDDEDGRINEDPIDPIIIEYTASTHSLCAKLPTGQVDVLSDQVTRFEVQYLGLIGGDDPLYRILIELTGASGRSVVLETKVMHRNARQSCGSMVKTLN